MNTKAEIPSNLTSKYTRACIPLLALIVMVMQGCASYTKWRVDAMEPSQKGIAVESVSIQPFTGEGREHGTTFARLLAGQLTQQGFVKLKQKGAQGHIVGSLDGTRTKYETWREKYKRKGKTRYRYHAKVRKSLTASYTLSANGQTWSESYTEEYSDEESSRDSYSAAKAELKSEARIQRQLMTTLAMKISQDITPYRVRKTYKLKLGDTDHLELGADYAKLGREEQAMSIFRQITERTQNDEDRAAALYNMGVIYEIRGDFNKAFDAYRNASQFHLEELMYPKAITRLESVISKRNQVDKQMKVFEK
ncbi:DUF6340 family protein [Marinobacter sp. S6332]|uniref:DUF6340 family protein n=1 Tax=Marinobacter sp. S6332 TaxID=2926403 RepID=UPI001FF2C38E|nr:DUF6340 family protein [Marinobacter sp. S6332]MCK0162354.1 tetratricopeptide repeat protein [Marinobacter sp. S6332]